MSQIVDVEVGVIKATAVIPTMEYVMFKYGKEVYRSIIETLNESQQRTFRKRMPKEHWIDLSDFIDFNKAILDRVYAGDYSKAKDLGKLSADYGMSTFLKLFVRVGGVNFFVKKATSVFATYYRPARMILSKNERGAAQVHVLRLVDKNNILENRIIGFIQNLIERCGCKNVKVWTTPIPNKEHSFVVDCTWD